MGDRRFDRPLSDVLRHLGTSRSFGFTDDERAAITAAADAIDRALPNRPEVLVTAGQTVDPVVAEVMDVVQAIRGQADGLAVLEDRVNDLARQLRHAPDEQGDNRG